MTPAVHAPAVVTPAVHAPAVDAPVVISAVVTPAVVATFIDDPVGEAQSVEVIAVLSDSIAWNSEERAWIYVPSNMHYSPKTDTYYAFISDVEGESRSLLSYIDGEGLSLTRTGEIGEDNKCKFYDVTWDRKFIYSPNFNGYAPDLLIFFGFVHAVGPTSAISSSLSSSKDV